MLVVLLMLLAPCRVRHSIQSQLEVPVTKALNVSKAALSTGAACQLSAELVAQSNTSSKTNPDWGIPFLLPDALQQVSPIAGGSGQKQVVAARHQASDIPLYILYRKMRVLS